MASRKLTKSPLAKVKARGARLAATTTKGTALAKRPTTKSTALAKRPPTTAKLALVGTSRPSTGAITSQPSVRAQRVWTASQVRMMQFAADSGDMWALGDLCDQMMADDRIGNLLETLAGSVLGCDLSFEAGPRDKVGDADLAEEIEADFPLGWGEDELSNFIAWRELVGFCWARHEKWFDTADGRVAPKFHVWHPKNFAWDDAARVWTVRDAMGRRSVAIPGQGEWVLYTRRGEFRPWSTGLWRGLSKWWMLKQYAMSDWGVHSEKGSKLVLSAAEGVTPEMRRELADEVKALAKDAVISLPVGCSMDLLELSANTRDIYQAQIDAADMGFAIAILGQNLTSRVDGGSLAAANSHERKENKRVRYIAKSMSQVLYQQSLPWWTEFNFGPTAQVPFPRYQTDPPEDNGEKVDTLAGLAGALVSLQTAGYRLETQYIEQQYGIKLLELTPEERQRTLPTQQPGEPAPPALPGGPGATPRRRRLQPTPPPPQRQAAARLAKHDAAGADATVDAQEYVDAVVDDSVDHAIDALAPFIGRIERAVKNATDFASARRAILDAFRDEEDPELLESLVEAGIVMAHLAGRHAVQVDIDAEPDDDDLSGDGA